MYVMTVIRKKKFNSGLDQMNIEPELAVEMHVSCMISGEEIDGTSQAPRDHVINHTCQQWYAIERHESEIADYQ